jgi:hypothetical protein
VQNNPLRAFRQDQILMMEVQHIGGYARALQRLKGQGLLVRAAGVRG